MEPVPQEQTRYDSGARRKSHRAGAQTGISIYIPAAVLRAAGIDPHGEPPEWQIFVPAKSKHSAMLRFYTP